MKKHTFPAFQFYVGDWSSSTEVKVMSAEQRGCYIDLLAHSWPNGIDNSLPIWRLTACRSEAEWDMLSALVLAQFVEIDGKLFHPKLLGQLKERVAFIRKQRDNGRKGGRPKNNPDLFSGFGETEPRETSSVSILQSSAFSLQSSVTNGKSSDRESANQSASQRQGKGQPGTPSLDPGTGHKQDILDRDLVEFWARTKSNWWYKKGPTSEITDRNFTKAAKQCRDWLERAGLKGRKAFMVEYGKAMAPELPDPPNYKEGESEVPKSKAFQIED